MNDQNWLAQGFEENRGHLRAVAYRMLGSASEADDAVQEAWLRLSRSDASTIENLGGWLTTVVSRVCLDMLRSRMAKREEALDTSATESIAASERPNDPEQETLLADSVGFALLIVLDRLDPAERLAFGYTTSSRFPSMRLLRFLPGRPRPRDNSRAGHAGEFKERPRFPSPASPNSDKSPTHFSLPCAPATLKGSSRCLIPM
jgi:RNA polymerase sigma factor (sigma-70 family)